MQNANMGDKEPNVRHVEVLLSANMDDKDHIVRHVEVLLSANMEKRKQDARPVVVLICVNLLGAMHVETRSMMASVFTAICISSLTLP